jgi:hypothetical protein
MTRVASALHGRQMKVGTRRRRAPDAEKNEEQTINEQRMLMLAQGIFLFKTSYSMFVIQNLRRKKMSNRRLMNNEC